MYWDWKNQKWTNKPIIPYWQRNFTPEQRRRTEALTAAYARIHEDPEYKRLSAVYWRRFGERRAYRGYDPDPNHRRLKEAEKALEDYQAAFDRAAYERILAEFGKGV